MADQDLETATPVSKDHQPNTATNPLNVTHVEAGAATVLAKEATLATRATESTVQALVDRTGEVQANPTANTVLERIKVIKTQLDVVLSSRASETSMASVATKLGDAATNGTVIKELLDIQNLLTSLESRVGEVAANPTANTVQDRLKAIQTIVNLISGQTGIDGGTGNASAKTPRVVLATDQPALTTPMPVNPNRVWNYTTPVKVSVLVTSTEVVAAGTPGTPRRLRVRVSLNAVVSAAFVAVWANANGATAAADQMPLGAGDVWEWETDEALNMIRAGAANVDVYAEVGTLA